MKKWRVVSDQVSGFPIENVGNDGGGAGMPVPDSSHRGLAPDSSYRGTDSPLFTRHSPLITRPSPHHLGFSLTELMIVVAIIGILAAIAIPNFLKYQARAKQAEAKNNLVAIHAGELAYFAENNKYSDDFNAIGFGVTGSSQRYYYELGKSSAGTLPAGCTASNLDKVSDNAFTAVAIANIDNDATCDVWSINEQKTLTNVTNDVAS